MKIILQCVLSVVLILSLGTTAIAQKKVSHQQMYRIRYSGRYNLSKDWKINLDLEDRRYAFPDRQQDWILPQISVNRALGNSWSTYFGFRYQLSARPNAPDKPVKFSNPKLRLYGGMDYKQKIQKLTYSHGYRLKEIFERKNNGEHLIPGYDLNFFFSYILGLQYPLTKSGNLNVKIGDEIELNFGHLVYNTFSKNEFYVGLNYEFSKHAAIEMRYMNQFQQNRKGDDYISRDILRMTVYHTINFY